MCSGVRAWERLGTQSFGAAQAGSGLCPSMAFVLPLKTTQSSPAWSSGLRSTQNPPGLESGPGVWAILHLCVQSVPANHGKVPTAHSQSWEAQRALPALSGLPTPGVSPFPKQPGDLWLLPSSWPRTGPSECRSASWCPSSRKPRWASQCSASVPSASTGETPQPHLPCPALPSLPPSFPGTPGTTRSSFPVPGWGQDALVWS